MRKYKLRSDSVWNGLTEEQGARLDDWLFAERLSHTEALERAGKELGITASLASMGRYYRYRRHERALEDLSGVERTAKAVNGMPVKLVCLRDSSLKMIGKLLLESTMDGSNVEAVSALARVLLEGERRQIQRERLELAREKFHFNAAEAALAELPHVGELTAEEMEREKARVQGIIKRIFGKEAPIDT